LPNPRSIAQHEKLRFENVEQRRDAGFKFGHWLVSAIGRRLYARQPSLAGVPEPTLILAAENRNIAAGVATIASHNQKSSEAFDVGLANGQGISRCVNRIVS
jgi:hypothetical protein